MEISLWGDNIPYLDVGADTPNSMTTYFLDTDKPLACIVVLPGGGYSERAPHEGEPIAKFFNSRGMHAVVVNYRVAPFSLTPFTWTYPLGGRSLYFTLFPFFGSKRP